MANSIRVQAGAALVAMLMVALLVFQTSSAAFSGTTASTGNSLSAASVTLSDDDSGGVMFNVSNMKPGDTASVKCIKVTYTGSVAASVKMYGAIGGGTGLGQYLDVVITSGDGGTFADCSAFVADTAIYTGTLANFATTHANWSNGLAADFSPTAANEAKTYKISITIQDNNAAQGLTANPVSFTWEAQNT